MNTFTQENWSWKLTNEDNYVITSGIITPTSTTSMFLVEDEQCLSTLLLAGIDEAITIKEDETCNRDIIAMHIANYGITEMEAYTYADRWHNPPEPYLDFNKCRAMENEQTQGEI